jgi:hypothetical protein
MALQLIPIMPDMSLSRSLSSSVPFILSTEYITNLLLRTILFIEGTNEYQSLSSISEFIFGCLDMSVTSNPSQNNQSMYLKNKALPRLKGVSPIVSNGHILTESLTSSALSLLWHLHRNQDFSYDKVIIATPEIRLQDLFETSKPDNSSVQQLHFVRLTALGQLLIITVPSGDLTE